MYPQLIPYPDYQQSVPQTGYRILAQQSEENILVYQAYNPAIANYAVNNQCFGGNNFKYSRMSWIKPNFLWMMFRCGWAEKENQERVLGIWIKKKDFDTILAEAVYSSYQEHIYGNRENWKKSLEEKEGRLQWDPDHDIYGNKEERRAIQLGLKGDLLLEFGTKMIVQIVDFTDFVKAQKAKINAQQIAEVMVPKEWSYEVKDSALRKRLKLEEY